jgi:peptide deformylase
MKNPSYLYKILTYNNWQASQKQKSVTLGQNDDSFIHLSTDVQLEKIIAKFFSEEQQFAVLKLAVEKLEGNLVYETNPGGMNKYYHLYEGSIPFSAIIEAKIVYRQHLCDKLTLTLLGDPILRNPSRELSLEEILSDDIQSLIQDMKTTMRKAPGVGLAAPQIGRPIQLAVIEDVDHALLPQELLLERERQEIPFHVIINPKLEIGDVEYVEFVEGCLSIPGFVAVVPRAKKVRVECLNERGEHTVIHANGWYARILQHEIDHLNGHLYIDRACLPTFMTVPSYQVFWKDKSASEMKSDLSGLK